MVCTSVYYVSHSVVEELGLGPSHYREARVVLCWLFIDGNEKLIVCAKVGMTNRWLLRAPDVLKLGACNFRTHAETCWPTSPIIWRLEP